MRKRPIHIHLAKKMSLKVKVIKKKVRAKVKMTKTKRIIGLNGRLHSGKDSAFGDLVEIASPLTVQRAAFADKLKMSALAALGIEFTDAADAVRICNDLKESATVEVWTDDEEDEYRPKRVITGREYLQFYGTEAHREIFGDDFWVDALLPWRGSMYSQSSLSKCFPDADVIVITDVRFPNEAQRILDMGGEVWHIDADERLGPLPEDSHVSEHPLSDVYLTHWVDNNASLEHFHLNLDRAYHGR